MKNNENYTERKFIADLAKKGAKIKYIGRMCSTCAFKFNSEANLEPHNVMAASHCLLKEGQFNCHVTTGVDKGCECIGFLYAKQYLDSLTKE